MFDEQQRGERTRGVDEADEADEADERARRANWVARLPVRLPPQPSVSPPMGCQFQAPPKLPPKGQVRVGVVLGEGREGVRGEGGVV